MYADIGGMDIQKQEVREAVELPLTHFELYKQVSIEGPPNGKPLAAQVKTGCCEDQHLMCVCVLFPPDWYRPPERSADVRTSRLWENHAG